MNCEICVMKYSDVLQFIFDMTAGYIARVDSRSQRGKLAINLHLSAIALDQSSSDTLRITG